MTKLSIVRYEHLRIKSVVAASPKVVLALDTTNHQDQAILWQYDNHLMTANSGKRMSN